EDARRLRRVQPVGAHELERDRIPVPWRCEGSGAVGPKERDRTLLRRQRPRDVVNLPDLDLECGLAWTRRRGRPKRDGIADVPGQHPPPAGQQRRQKTGRGGHPELRPSGNRPGERRVRAVTLGPRDELLAYTAPKGESAA